jgi:hypothetical protein
LQAVAVAVAEKETMEPPVALAVVVAVELPVALELLELQTLEVAEVEQQDLPLVPAEPEALG